MSSTVPERAAVPATVEDQAARAPLLPSVSRRFIPVWRRHFLVWRKLAFERIVTNILEPVISIVAFGYGLGSLLPEIEGVSYLQFMASGSIVMSVMYSAKFESLWGAFTRMQAQKTWDGMLNTPMAIDDVLLGELIWAATKACFTGLCILLLIWILGISRAPLSLLALPAAFFVALTFSAMALVVNAVARDYEFLSNYFTVIVVPMVFVSGVFFPQSQLPDWLRGFAQWLPLKPAIDLIRPLILGSWPQHAGAAIALLVAYLLVFYWIAWHLTRRRLLK